MSAVRAADGTTVVNCFGEHGEANAQLIVAAVNAYLSAKPADTAATDSVASGPAVPAGVIEQRPRSVEEQLVLGIPLLWEPPDAGE